QAWGDFDADGSPDLLLTGTATQLLHNVNFGAALVPHALPGPVLTNGSGAWADFDNDGDLDLAICGNYVSNGALVVATRLLRNDGAGGFIDLNAGLTGLAYGDLAWGDFDNDGRVDLFITGTVPGIAYRT